MTIDTKGFVVMPGQGLVCDMAPGRSAALKLLSGETAESVMVFEETAPSSADTPFHLHRHSDEAAFVLSGEITFNIDDRITVGGPGTYAFVPRGVPHAWKNTGAETARILFLYTPAAAGKLFEEIERLKLSFGAMGEHELAEIFQRHGWETIGPPPF